MKLYVIGLGPGNEQHMTVQAQVALAECETVCGYTVYLDLISQRIVGKKTITTPMRGEVERCRLALQEAASGRITAMVSSGDAGIYGMAALIYELSQDYPAVEIHVIPGVTAASSGAALLGAPLSHDFAAISLSDLLTPWELIEKRLAAAASADFVLCLYNPASKRRHDYLQRACAVILQYKKKETVCGIADQISRAGEEVRILSLKELQNAQVDMFSTIFVGNEKTKVVRGKMVTPRGYKDV